MDPIDLYELDTEDPNRIKMFSFYNQIHYAKVVECYDGDTITCIFKYDRFIKIRIRMDGYDSPELKPLKIIPDRTTEIHKALLAKKRIEELILGKIVILYCKKFDKYGRLLADVKINETDEKTINQIMLDEGHGYEYHGGKKHNYSASE